MGSGPPPPPTKENGQQNKPSIREAIITVASHPELRFPTFRKCHRILPILRAEREMRCMVWVTQSGGFTISHSHAGLRMHGAGITRKSTSKICLCQSHNTLECRRTSPVGDFRFESRTHFRGQEADGRGAPALGKGQGF